MVDARRGRILSLATVGMALVLVRPAAGQDGGDGNPPRGLIPPTDVHVNDSLEAADAIAKAKALIARDRWSEAAEILQHTADAEGDKLVRDEGGTYVSVRGRINRMVAGWPEAGIAAYRTMFEREAKDALTAAMTTKQPERLLAVFERYFCTTAAVPLADTIGQLAIESGDLSLAEHVYRRVQEEHPDRTRHGPRCKAMLRLLGAMRGKQEGPIPPPTDDVAVPWMGEERPLSEVMPMVQEAFASFGGDPSPMDWPMFGGTPDRNRQASSGVDELGLLWTFDRFGPRSLGPTADRPDRPPEEPGGARSTAMYPAVAGGLTFVQQDREIVALHRTTGAEAWRLGSGEAVPSEVVYPDERPAGWESVTVHDGKLYASLPGARGGPSGGESSDRPPQVVCVEASSGKVLWKTDPQSIAEPFADVSFDGAPLVGGEHVLILGRRRRSFGFEDCYLYRFGAKRGGFVSRTHLGSASTGTFGSRQPTQGIIAADGEAVYACTNLGTIAALSPHTGLVRWLRMYPREHPTAGSGGRLGQDAAAWQFNPVMVSDGRLVVFPNDSSRILVLSTDRGELLHSLSASEIEDAAILLGLRGNQLCGVGRNAACYDLARGALLWSTPLPGKSEPAGRGVWVEAELLVPTREALSVIRAADGRRTDLAWSGEEQGGTLVALPDQLIVAGAGRVCGYVRRTEIWKTLHERMAAAPSDPIPALELAEVAQNNGEFEEAVKALDEAAQRVAARWDTLDGAVSRRLFDDAVAIAGRMHGRGALTPVVLAKLLGYASQFAPDPMAHISLRLQFAEIYAAMQLPEPAIRLYQQILRDRTLREVGLTIGGGPTTGGAVAQDHIAVLIGRHGRSVYAPFEAEARQWLASGQAAGDESSLERVAITFPNSEAAPLALIARGEGLARRGQAREAAKRFAQAYHRYPKDVDRPTLLRKIADAYEAAGLRVHAFWWLTKAAREHPTARVEHEGRSLSFLEYRSRLHDVRARVEPSRAKLTLPLNRSTTREFAAPVVLLAPRWGEAPTSDWSRYFVADSDGIHALAAGTDAGLWSQPAEVRGTPSLLIATDKQAVFATGESVFSLDPRTGTPLWSHGEPRRALADERGDWEDVDSIRSLAIHEDRLIILRNSGQMSCLDLSRGVPVWEQRHPVGPSGRVAVCDLGVLYATLLDGKAVIGVIDAVTGAWQTALPLEDSQAIEELDTTLDGQVIVVGSRSIACYDPETQRSQWRASTGGQIRRASVATEVDAMYFTDDGQRITKIGLEDGKQIWESESVASGGDDLTVTLQDSAVLVGSTGAVAAIDAVTGLTLWRGTAPDRARFVGRQVTQSYVVAVDVGNARDQEVTAFFYDHRNASGVIPADGGAPSLGRLSDVRAVLAVNGGLVVQAGTTIHVYANK